MCLLNKSVSTIAKRIHYDKICLPQQNVSDGYDSGLKLYSVLSSFAPQ